MKIRLLVLLLLCVILLDSCSSGKAAYKQGDYYQAVLTAVNRLRQNPDHKKSREVLGLSYTAAVEFLETDAKNQIASDANFKWNRAVENYEKINTLYEEIKRSPGASRVIANPVSRYKELTEVKGKAAEESYEAGIQAMLKNNRAEAKRAYFLFADVQRLSPGYRETIEMMNQAEYNATFRVAYSEVNASRENFTLQQALTPVNRQFLKFYTNAQALSDNVPIDHQLQLQYRGVDFPREANTSSTTEKLEKDIQVAEKVVNGKKEPVYEKVRAEVRVYTRSYRVTAEGVVQVTDVKSNGLAMNETIQGDANWTWQWATYSGDQRALNDNQRNLAKRKEAWPDRDELAKNARQDLVNNITNTVRRFYSSY